MPLNVFDKCLQICSDTWNKVLCNVIENLEYTEKRIFYCKLKKRIIFQIPTAIAKFYVESLQKLFLYFFEILFLNLH